MNSNVLSIKLKVLRDMKQEFHNKLTDLTDKIETKMQTSPCEIANKCFEMALLFLSQVFPNPESLEPLSHENEEEPLGIDTKLKELNTKLEDVGKKVESMFQLFDGKLKEQETKCTDQVKNSYEEVKAYASGLQLKQDQYHRQLRDHIKSSKKKQEQYESQLRDHIKSSKKKHEQYESQLTDHVRNSEKKQEQFEEFYKESNSEMEKLKAVTEINTKSIAGLRKLQTKLNVKMEESKTTTKAQQTPNTTASTSATTSQSSGATATAATFSGSPLSLRERETLEFGGYIEDAKLLSQNVILLADRTNYCVTLCSTEGQQLDSLKLHDKPYNLAILQENAGNSWEVAVCLNMSIRIDLITVKRHTLSKKSTITTQRPYTCLTLVDQTTLAASSVWSDDGVDLIDLKGTVLRTICSDIIPHCMLATQDQHLLVFHSNTFYKFDLKRGAQVMKCKVPEIRHPCSMASLQNDSYVVADFPSRALYLVSGDGQAKSKIPNILDKEALCNHITSVTVMGDICICCTYQGFATVFEIL